MNADTETSLGDLVRSVNLLIPRDESTRTAIAELLGFRIPQVRQDSFKQVAREHPRIEGGRKQITGVDLSPSSQIAEQPKAIPSTARSEAISKLLEPVEVEHEGLSGQWEARPQLEKISERHLQNERPYEPLFERRWARDLIAISMSTLRPTGAIEIGKLVTAFSRGQALKKIPRAPRRSVCWGIQLLIDMGVGMEPFSRDQTELTEQIRKVVGQDCVEEVLFSENPLRGVMDASGCDWMPYIPPRVGRPVVVLTDLGIGGPPLHPQRSQTSEWLEFADLVKKNDSFLIVLVPYPRGRWPLTLLKSMTVIQWDRNTTISKVKAAFKANG